jgi:hypothetical protein
MVASVLPVLDPGRRPHPGWSCKTLCAGLFLTSGEDLILGV